MCAIILYFLLVNVNSYNFTTVSNPIGLENIKATSITKNDVMITANTVIPVNHKIEYGIIGSFSNSISDNDLIIPHVKHSVSLPNLEPDTKYNYRFVSEHEDKIYASDVNLFRITPSDEPISLIDKK